MKLVPTSFPAKTRMRMTTEDIGKNLKLLDASVTLNSLPMENPPPENF